MTADLPDDVRQDDIDGEHEACPVCREEFDRLGRCDCDYGSPCGRAGDMWQMEGDEMSGTPKYIAIIDALNRRGLLTSEAGTVNNVEVQHDDSCPLLHGKPPCSCAVEVVVNGVAYGAEVLT